MLAAVSEIEGPLSLDGRHAAIRLGPNMQLGMDINEQREIGRPSNLTKGQMGWVLKENDMHGLHRAERAGSAATKGGCTFGGFFKDLSLPQPTRAAAPTAAAMAVATSAAAAAKKSAELKYTARSRRHG